MNTPRHAFRGELFWVSVGHGLLIGLLLGLSLYRGCEAPPDMNLPVELIVPEAGDDSAGDKSTPEAVKPAPDEVKPTPEPPPEKDDIPAPEAVKPQADKARPDIKKKPDVKKSDPRKNKIEVSKTLIKRTSKQGSGGSKTKLSREEIQRLLDRGAKTGKPTLSDAQLRSLLDSSTKFGEGSPMTQERLYLELVRQTLYRAWDQPTQIGIAGLVARVELSLSADGSVAGSRLLGGSGNAIMDESVMRAVRSVRRISGLPAEFVLSHRRITVAFELTGNR